MFYLSVERKKWETYSTLRSLKSSYMHLVISIFGFNSLKGTFFAKEMFEIKDETVKFRMLHT